jgi:hypothetical protein
MKKIFLLIFLSFLVYEGKSQIYLTNPIYGITYNRIKANNALNLPKIADTTNYQSTDTTNLFGVFQGKIIYFFNHHWHLVGSGTGGGVTPTDNLLHWDSFNNYYTPFSAYNTNSFYWNGSMLDFGGILNAGRLQGRDSVYIKSHWGGGTTPIDGIWHWDGSSLNPYSSSIANKFDNSSTHPSDFSNHLNYNGQFWVTNIIAGTTASSATALNGYSDNAHGAYLQTNSASGVNANALTTGNAVVGSANSGYAGWFISKGNTIVRFDSATVNQAKITNTGLFIVKTDTLATKAYARAHGGGGGSNPDTTKTVHIGHYATQYDLSKKFNKTDTLPASQIKYASGDTVNISSVALVPSDTTTNLGSRKLETKYNAAVSLAAKQNSLTLTTTGSSGASTLIGSTLNIPQYSGGGGGYSLPIATNNILGGVKIGSKMIISSGILNTKDSALFRNGSFTGNMNIGDTTYSIPLILYGMGSSISAGAYATPIPQNSYLGRLSTDYGWTLFNRASSGSKVVKTSTGDSSMVDKMHTYPLYNGTQSYFIFDAGINDNAGDTVTYKIALSQVLDSLIIRKSWPASKIIVVSPTPSPTRLVDSVFIKVNNTVCIIKGSVAVDVWHPMRIIYKSNHNIFNIDSLHPSTLGHYYLEKIITGFIPNTVHMAGNQLIYGNSTVNKNIYIGGNDTIKGYNYVKGTSFLTGGITQKMVNGALSLYQPYISTGGDFGELRFVPNKLNTNFLDSFSLAYIGQGSSNQFAIKRLGTGAINEWLVNNDDAQIWHGTLANIQSGYKYTMYGGGAYINGKGYINGSITVTGDAVTSDQRLMLYKNGNSRVALGVNSSGVLLIGNGVNTTQIGTISGTDGTTFTPTLYCTSGNNVGIGINPISYKLDVAGNIHGSGSLTIDGTWSLGGDATTNQQKLLLYKNANARVAIGVASDGSMQFGDGVNNFQFGTISGTDGTTFSQNAIITSVGKVGLGNYLPTAILQLKSGTSTAGTAPLKMARYSPSLMSTPEKYAVEVDSTISTGSNIYFTDNTATRYILAKTLTVTATLDFGSTAAQNNTDLTITLTGAAIGDIVELGTANASVLANSSFTAFVSASNTITVRFNNYSTSTQDPASGTFRVAIIKY